MDSGHAVAVGHAPLHFGDVFVRQREIFGKHVTEVKQECGDRIDIVDRQGLGIVPRHRAVDVIPQRRYRGQLHQSGTRWIIFAFQIGHPTRLDVCSRRAADQGHEEFIRLAKDAMARRTARLPNILSFQNRPRTGRQTLEIRTNINIPCRDFGGRCRAPNARVLGRSCVLRGTCPTNRQGSQQCERSQALRKAVHFSLLHFPAPAKTE